METKVLLVDDDVAIVEMIEMSLLLDGYHVRTANNGSAGLAAARELSPDVVVLDIMMPEMDGWEVARGLRADPSLGRVPIIIMTAKASLAEQWSGWREGIDSYVTKPFDVEVLRAEIDRVVTQATQPQAAHEH